MQTSYPTAMGVAIPGMLADMGPKDIVSKTHASLKVLFGLFIARGADNELGKIPALATDITTNGVGFVVADQSQECIGDAAAPGVPAGKQFNVLKKGRLWVTCEDPSNYAYGMQASVRYAGTGVAGGLVCTPVSMETALVPNSKLLAKSGSLVLVEVNNV